MNPGLAGGRVAKAKGLNCPNCGGSVELRGFAHTLSAICPSCHSVLDTSTPIIKVLQTVQVAEVYEPQIPLGTRGEIDGATYEAIGFQRREIPDEGDGWFEYLLFNPHRGFRYLSEYRGHWNLIDTVHAIPRYTSSGGKRAVEMQGKVYTHFDGVTAVTSYVVGEFPWRVQVGEAAQADDYVNPPFMLSSETMAGEVVWSRGVYRTSEQIWRCFKLPLPAPAASGIFMNQPSPKEGRPRSAWKLWFWLQMALLAVALLFTATSQRKVAFEKGYATAAPPPTSTPTPTTPNPDDDEPPPATPAPAPVQQDTLAVTDAITLTGRTSNVELTIRSDLSGAYDAYFNISLIDDNTNQSIREFNRDLTRTHTTDSVEIPTIPSGRYRFRIRPTIDPPTAPLIYTVRVRRDVPTWSWFWFASLLLLIPPIFTWIGARSFESSRWSQSDSAPAGSVPSGPEPAATQ